MKSLRPGSALLIVLGMMTFVVVSAIGFAAYMRYARMPSSYLRRTSASRLLAKAALAEAIDALDFSIGNSTWPGKSGTQIRDYQRIEDDDANTPVNVYDTWMDYCYVGTNTLLALTEQADEQVVPTTVATLTTEALAYLPPGIINEVRYYSRRALSGKWHSLGFDSGRYAFSAVDVSDFFDVNRTRCYLKNPQGGGILYGRNSSDDGRISLAYAFETPSHDDYIVDPVAWDRFVDLYRGPGKVPFVSLADLNLAINKQGLPAELSPFCRFVNSGENFVTDNSDRDPEAHLLRHMNFVTDSYYPMTNRVDAALDLSREQDQPFYGLGPIDKTDAESQLSVNDIINSDGNRYADRLDQLNSRLNNDPEFIQLCDYLDANSVPASLALPTVERTPMITGVALEGKLALEIVKEEETKDNGKVVKGPDGKPQYLYLATTYTVKLKDDGGLKVYAGTVYPFKHARGTEKSYALESVATVSFVPECNPATDAEGLLRCPDAVQPAVVTCDKGWQDVQTKWNVDSLASSRTVVFACRSSAKNVPFNPEPRSEKDAIAEADVEVQFPSFGNQALATKLPASDYYNEHVCTYRTCRRCVWEVSEDGTKAGWSDPQPFDTPIEQRIGLLPFKKNLSGAVAAEDFVDGLYIPTVQVWTRIYETGGSKATVDLVPACWKDDPQPFNMTDYARGSSQYPLLRFRLSQGVDFNFKDGELKLNETEDQAKFLPQMYLTDDPRFNYAPENFIAVDGVETQMKEAWWQRHRAGAGDRDGDIFMATSDAGYLQSPYELANIVAVSRGENNALSWGCADGTGYNGKARTSFADCPADSAMWRTYSQYADGWAGGDIDRLDILTGTHGTRVSPYARRKEVLMAALANTPLDWWAASTNKDVNAVAHKDADAADDWAFNGANTRAGNRFRIEYGELEQMALNLKAKFRNAQVNEDWRTQFDEQAWWNSGISADEDGTEYSSLCGVQLQYAKLHAVDRKFLHGFWKECFAYRQQLFMIFVRAEPMMMGGGALGQTPPQLGARAMALVWRDPRKTQAGTLNTGAASAPHRTRVLFYRQFE